MKNEKQNAEHPSVAETRKFMDLLIEGNYDELERFNEGGDFELIKIMLKGTKKMQYRLNSIKYNDEKAIVNITIRQPDLRVVNDKAVENFEKEDIDYDLLTDEEKNSVVKRILNKTIQEELESDNLEYFKETLDLTYTKKGRNWIRETSNEDEFFDILMSKLNQE